MALKDHVVLVLLALGLIVYILVGAAVFWAIESPLEEANVQLSTSTFTNFLANNTCVSEADLMALLTVVNQLSDAGVTVGNTTQTSSSWSYASSVFFSGTVVTTIGYGNQSPTVLASQIFCCFYLFFGIPMCLVLLGKVGDLIAKMNNALVDKLVKWSKGERKRSVLSLGLLVVNGSILLVFIPCIAFSYVEGWSYGTSIYFTFVTLSTVGFGDYYLGAATTSGIYRIANGFWIFFGLAWFASILSTVQEEMASTVDKKQNPKDAELEAPQTDEGKATSVETIAS